MLRVALKRMEKLFGILSECFKNLSLAIDNQDCDHLMFTMMQLRDHFVAIGAQRCHFLCERTLELESKYQMLSSDSKSTKKFSQFLATYPCLMELYVQYLLHIDYVVWQLNLGSDFLLSHIQSLCLNSCFNLVHHCHQVICVTRIALCDENLKSLLRQPHPFYLKYQLFSLVPDSRLAQGFSQSNLQDLHQLDLQKNEAQICFLTKSIHIDKFVKKVNDIVNVEEVKIVENASILSGRSELKSLNMSSKTPRNMQSRSVSNMKL